MSGPLRVLLVEDSPEDAALVIHELRKFDSAVDVERVDTAETMRAALERREWDVVISDWSMPRFSAPDALDILKDMRPGMPFILVSATIGEEAAVAAMRAGAHDFVLKDRLGKLNAVVERELRKVQERAARQRAEDALRQSEARFARLSESGIVGILTADIHGNIFDANDAYLQMVGYSKDELASGAVQWTHLTPTEWVASDAIAAEQLRAKGFAQPWEKESFRKDGGRVPILIGAAMLDDVRCVMFVVDLTKQRRAEEALHRSEEQLRHAQKMEAVGRLAGGVAHDFNNVLSVILGYTSMMLADLDVPSYLRTDLEEVLKAGTRAADLTRQLLLFSRQQVPEPRVIDVNDLLSGMEKMLQRILGEDVELALVPANELGHVRADPGHMEQVVMNLVVNARDAMPQGGRLTIETANVMLDDEYVSTHLPAKPGPHVMIAVTDTGIGMDRDTQQRIFEPFFTTKETAKGTGLGLSTAFGIIQQSGGHIWVYSELSKGTTFRVYLPSVSESADVLLAPAVVEPQMGTETILVVEDDEQVRRVAVALLRTCGYRVVVAYTALDAIRLVEHSAEMIDLLLTDVVMPKTSGPELAEQLVALRPNLKVLCMSGYADDSIVGHGVLGRGVAFIQKPLTADSLSRKIREILDSPAANVVASGWR